MNRRQFLGLGAAVGTASVAGCTLGTAAESPGSSGASVALEPVATGLSFPVSMEFLPDGTVWTAELFGQIRQVTDARPAETPVLDISDRMAEIRGERGLVGFTLHPEFGDGDNDRFYVRYSAPLASAADPAVANNDELSHVAVLSEFRASADPVRGSERRVLEVPQPAPTHNAGAIEFGPNGYLYVAFGDGQRTNFDGDTWSWWYDKGQQAQNLEDNLLGGILRIDVDRTSGDRAYAVPADNPLVGESGRDEYYVWGLRNPYRMSFDGDRLFVGQVGEKTREAVFLVDATDQDERNMGWPLVEGSACSSSTSLGYALGQNPLNLFNPKTWQSLTNRLSPVDLCPSPENAPTPEDSRGEFAQPIIEYSREGGRSVTGGCVYRGDAIPELQGQYIFGDYVAPSPLFAASPPDDGSRPWPIAELEVTTTASGRLPATDERTEQVLGFARDADGEVVLVTRNQRQPSGGGGRALRLAPAE